MSRAVLEVAARQWNHRRDALSVPTARAGNLTAVAPRGTDDQVRIGLDQLGSTDPVAVIDVGESSLLGPAAVAVHDHRDMAGTVGGASWRASRRS